MATLQNSPSPHRTLVLNSFTKVQNKQSNSHCYRRSVSFLVRAEQASSSSACSPSQDRSGRRQVLAAGTIASMAYLTNQHSASFAAEKKKDFQLVTDKKDGYEFVYPFGWQEVSIEGQDKVFKDVIEPLETASVTLFPTVKEDIKEFGTPQEVAETLIKKVLAPPTQKTKLIEATEHEIDGKTYYTFEFMAKAPNYTRHALSTIAVNNGKFYTLTTGANERRWGKMKDKLHTIVDSFKLFKVYEGNLS
ncbi:PREDICTED: psbP-like protein 1, chloroplastic isoform X1 [Fragaria vesca subsp. vesca]|uniref:psbP-like protein 1, chloroplastic isoform X1 n=1 Tax=Fragaria vesca subsp. vesca TaxID=101020 RepID=UPI0002C3348F|nr:PREDICTED: psbP-like protein 1, chloroplastic isoform X1 [Fragaria vesca subsp. vesca]